MREFRDALAGLLAEAGCRLRARASPVAGCDDETARIQDFTVAASDPDPMVRSAAVTALARLAGNEQPEIIYPFLEDSSENAGFRLSGLNPPREPGRDYARRANSSAARSLP